jgi:RimJ/RimL family protein N-acetyltransferase
VSGQDAVPDALEVRPATADDAALLLRWRNDPEVRAWSRSTEETPREEHEAWLRGVLADPDRHLLVVLRASDGEPVATTRYDLVTGDRSGWEISITVAPGMRGKGVGSATLQASDAWLARAEPTAREVVAHVRPANTGSHLLFERNGYRNATPDEAEMDRLVRVLDGP